MAYFPEQPELEQRIVEWMNHERFSTDDLGQELLARQPVIVRDSLVEPRGFKPMIEFSLTRSYVAAPIAPAGRLIGVLYADRYPTERDVDELDRDMLSAFAEDFGLIYERVVLVERMRAQRDQIDKAFEFAQNMMTSLATAEIDLARTSALPIPGEEDPYLGTPPAPASVQETLTPREVEVLMLMVRGATNADIAERLIIRRGTVKSHVKHILRKLDAVNRAEAIARYMGRPHVS
jgi:DNA-binding CsgD family transcriptional regulator